ncbi:hypothetical protein RHIZ404_230282 [Rhizobium sp. EC-SD404]|nr:hypothetical protein RHIZ404_230282 [Rhizobium sp. EC-SD404]
MRRSFYRVITHTGNVTHTGKTDPQNLEPLALLEGSMFFYSISTVYAKFTPSGTLFRPSV